MTRPTNRGVELDRQLNDPARYKRMCDIVRDAGGDHAWTSQVPTGELSCWIVGKAVILVQRIGDGVEMYSNMG